jgi:hypothetical protein
MSVTDLIADLPFIVLGVIVTIVMPGIAFKPNVAIGSKHERTYRLPTIRRNLLVLAKEPYDFRCLILTGSPLNSGGGGGSW